MRRIATLLAVFSLLVTGCGTKKPPTQSVEVTVYLQRDVTEQQKQSIRAAIQALPGVTELIFETREEAYANFKEIFKDAPDMVGSVRPEDMPESFRFRLPDQASVDSATKSLSSLPGVDTVVSPPVLSPWPSGLPSRT